MSSFRSLQAPPFRIPLQLLKLLSRVYEESPSSGVGLRHVDERAETAGIKNVVMDEVMGVET